MEAYHLLVVMDGGDKVVGAIIFPRDAQRRSRVGGMYWFGENRSIRVSPEMLSEIIQSHRNQLIGL